MPVSRFFGPAQPSAITVVDPPVSQSYARRARITFFVVAPVSSLVVLAVTSPSTWLPLAVVVSAVAGLVVGAFSALLVAVWPVLRVLWWWSLEIVTTVGSLAAFSALAHVSHLLVAFGVLVGVVVAVWLIRPARRWVSRWSWCVVDRHRLRVFFAALIKATSAQNAGLLPLVLWARPTPAGERVWAWLRPGLDIGALEGKAGRLAVTCWSGEARMVRASRRYAALVRIDIHRRDPLTGTVSSPLSMLLPEGFKRPAVAQGLPAVGLDLDDIPEPVEEAAPMRRR